MRDLRIFLSLKHLNVVTGLLTDLTSNCRVSGNRKAWGGKQKWGNGRLVQQSEHTQHLAYHLIQVWSWHPPSNYNSNVEDHWPYVTITNIIIINILKYCESYENVTQKLEVSKYYWKHSTDRLAWNKVPQTSDLQKNTVVAKYDRVKPNKTQYIYIPDFLYTVYLYTRFSLSIHLLVDM